MENNLKKMYRYETTHFSQKIMWIRKYNAPVFVVSLNTTGLDAAADEIIEINCSKCELIGNELIPVDEFHSLVKPVHKPSEFIFNYTGINIDELRKASSLKDAFTKFVEFTGETPVIFGYQMIDFTIPFLSAAASKCDIKFDTKRNCDIRELVRAVLMKNSSLHSYSYKTVAEKLNCTGTPVEKFIAIFNKTYSLFPKGHDKANYNEINYWGKSHQARYLYVKTDHGQISINANSGFWIEDVPGYFDTVDMDALTKTIYARENVTTVWELIAKYE